jgi:hypothetical protein
MIVSFLVWFENKEMKNEIHIRIQITVTYCIQTLSVILPKTYFWPDLSLSAPMSLSAAIAISSTYSIAISSTYSIVISSTYSIVISSTYSIVISSTYCQHLLSLLPALIVISIVGAYTVTVSTNCY